MFTSICILGRQSRIALAELESLFGTENIKPLEQGASLVNLDTESIPLQRIGGTIKVGKVLAELSTNNWHEISAHLIKNIPKHIEHVPEGKIKLGISTYGFPVGPNAINATALEVKKAVKQSGRSIRVIPNSTTELNSAQVLRNKLTDYLGLEILLIKHGSKTILAQTRQIQDIDAYAARDQMRPARDARVGMLPPKLAQTIINLASPETFGSLLDPFCGTGVILQEALLMGYDVYGTDLEERMINYSRRNLDWLGDQPGNQLKNSYLLEVGDATNFEWQEFDAIASETYLGRPFSTEPKPEKLREVIQDVNTIHKKFFENIARQTHPGFKMCVAVPAWHTKYGVKHLPLLDHLTDMGYTRISFVHAKDAELIYHREGQIVGRELVVLIRK